MDKFDDISKANLEQILYYSLHDADSAYHSDEDGWQLHDYVKDETISIVGDRFDVSDNDIKNINNT